MLYLTIGGVAAALGGATARNVVRARARRAARDLERGTEAMKQEVEREMQSR
jgi:hypothetical protein